MEANLISPTRSNNMFSREVSDIVVATMATFLLFLNTEQTAELTQLSYLKGMMVILLGLNFLHLILSQLNRISNSQSRMLAVFDTVLILSALILFSLNINKINEIAGFWDFLPSGYLVINYLAYTIMLIFSILAVNARFLYIRQDKRKQKSPE